MISLMPGRKYKIVLSSGQTITLRFDGLGSNQQQIWIHPESGSVVHPLPPYIRIDPA